MIRNKDKIFGEMNDPNTVLTSGTLTLNKLIVGAGNKAIKSFAPGAKRLIYLDANGNVAGFNYNTANKCIGTDGNGNLALLDPPTIKSFVFGGHKNLITNVTWVSSSFEASVAWGVTSSADGGSYIYQKTKNIGTTWRADETKLDFANGLTLNSTTTVYMCLTAAATRINGGFFYNVAKFYRSNGTYTEVKNELASNALSIDGNGLFINREVSLPAGTYTRIGLVPRNLQTDYEQRIFFNCAILYGG